MTPLEKKKIYLVNVNTIRSKEFFLIIKLFKTLLNRLHMQKLQFYFFKKSKQFTLAFLQALFISVSVFVSAKRIKLKPT